MKKTLVQLLESMAKLTKQQGDLDHFKLGNALHDLASIMHNEMEEDEILIDNVAFEILSELGILAEVKLKNLHWYSYRTRGFSPGCQPNDLVEWDDEYGKFGAIAYKRELSPQELEDYELTKIER